MCNTNSKWNQNSSNPVGTGEVNSQIMVPVSFPLVGTSSALVKPEESEMWCQTMIQCLNYINNSLTLCELQK